MSSRFILVATLATAATLAVSKSATPTGSTVSREQRKAETAAANKSGELTPAGQGGAPQPKTTKTTSSKTREQRKAETVEARKQGELVPAGQGSPK